MIGFVEPRAQSAGVCVRDGNVSNFKIKMLYNSKSRRYLRISLSEDAAFRLLDVEYVAEGIVLARAKGLEGPNLARRGVSLERWMPVS